MLVIAMTVALGRWEEYALHVRAALQSGDLSQDDLKEILLQSAIYCGVPAANHAFKEARAVIDSLVPAQEPREEMKPSTLHAVESGSGDAVVLVHAIGCDHRMWDSLAAALVAALPRDPRRRARPRQESRAEGPLFARGTGRRRARAARQARHRPRALGGALDGRHDRPGLRDRSSRAPASPRARQHNQFLRGRGAETLGRAHQGR